jgi:DNA-binding SARP family transcriptional activator/tetratricopeptide (TPR) repeat protein
MRFRVLGPMEFFDSAEWRPIGAAKWRTLLALLLIDADRVVSGDRLAAEMWADSPPKTVDNQIHGYVSRLRRLFGPGQEHLLVTQAPGYRLRVGPEESDLGQFVTLADRGRSALRAGGLDAAARDLDAALGLWRGTAFEDVPTTPSVQAAVARLADARMDATEDLTEVRLLRGEHGAVVTELADLVALHPFRERLRQLQMLALYRQDRQADALAAYGELRTLLAEELGVDPSQHVRQLYEQILRADPTLLAPVADTEGTVPTNLVLPVHQLPPDVPDFTDRTEPLAAVLETLAARTDSGPPPVAVVVGGPGVGKSSLAVHSAHAANEQFPDGQLYLDLAGTSARPRDPGELLAEILGALGVSGNCVPDDLSARASLYRSLLARRRMLLVLDDAAHTRQVRPLLPSTGSCALLITSRRQVTDLAGARHIELDMLPPEAARQLFTAIVGQQRVAAEAEHADAILRSCGYLPLAIRISGGKLASRTRWPLQVLRERLADESRRLNELRVGELGVRASFDLSLRLLPAEAVRAFAFLGLLGGQPVPAWVLGPLLDRDDADDILDVLLDANLIQITDTDAIGQPRYRLHDLLRTYAVEATDGFPPQSRRAAVERLLAAWLHLAEHAAEHLPPSLFRPTPGTSPRRQLPPDLTRRVAADPLAWFDAERATLRAAVTLAAEWDLDELAWELAAALVPYYDLRSLHHDWRHSHHTALGPNRAADNERGEAVLRSGLAQVQVYRDDFDSARPNLLRSLELYRRLGDKRGEALAAASLATIERVLGDHDQALAHAMNALDLVTATGDRHIEAQLRNGVAVIHLAQQRLDEARARFHEALELSRQLGDVHREAVVLREMSRLHSKRGDAASALEHLGRALTIFDTLHDERCMAYTLLGMGRVHATRQEKAHASKALTRAAELFKQYGDRMEEATCWQLLGELNTEHQDLPTARIYLTHALQIWQTFGADQQATAITAELERLAR